MSVIQLTISKEEISQRKERLKTLLKTQQMGVVAIHKELLYLDTFFNEYPVLPEHVETLSYQWFDDSILKITLDGILPYFDKEDGKYYRTMRDFYIQQLVHFAKNEGIRARFEPAFLAIIQFFPDLTIRDYDNRSRKFIIDGLRLSGLIADDNWMKVSILEDGFLDQEWPRTEILIGKRENRDKIMGMVP